MQLSAKQIRKSAPKIVSDFLLIHACMILALNIALFYHHFVDGPDAATGLLERLTQYYLLFFCPLSLLFPVVFLLSAVYTRSAAYVPRQKAFALLRAIGLSLLLFVVANYLIFRESLVPRSVAVLFCVLTMTVLTSARFIKLLLLRYVATEQSEASQSIQDCPVLVVGGAGYIGSVLVRRLLKFGYRVRVLDSLVYGDAAIRELANHPRFELLVGDSRDIQSVVAAVRGVKAIVHLAAIVGDPACEQERQAALEINYAATRMLIEIAKGHGVERLIFASSCSVYGATDFVMDENSALNPISLYAQTKIDSERALLKSASDTFHPIILRLATVFGDSYRPRFDLVVNLLTAKAFKDGVITIFNGQQWRPFIHVLDIAEAMLKMLTTDVTLVGGQVFNVGDSRFNYTLTQVAESILSIFPGVRVKHVENSDLRNYRVSFEKIHRELGFQCRISVPDGVMELKRAFERGAVTDYTDPYYHNQRYLQSVARPAPVDETASLVMAAFADGRSSSVSV